MWDSYFYSEPVYRKGIPNKGIIIFNHPIQFIKPLFVQSAGAVEYTDCTSTKG